MLIIKRQTDAALNSHSVMHELLTPKNDKFVNPAANNFENLDYNY